MNKTKKGLGIRGEEVELDLSQLGLKQNTGKGCGAVPDPRCRAPLWIERRGTVRRRSSRRRDITVPTALVSGACRPPRKGADDGDGLGGIGDWAHGGGAAAWGSEEIRGRPI
jgi:hypothetical protein